MVWLKYHDVQILSMTSVILLTAMCIFVMNVFIGLNMISVYADSSSLPYCATGKGEDGIKVKICSVDREKCDKNLEENKISTKCKATH